MTSTRLEFDQVAQGLFFWPVRALDRGLRHAGVRRAVKVAVDFCCGAAAVVTAVAVSEGIATVGVAETASLALLVGLVLVVADGLGGSYRAIWRYTSMREAITLGVSSGVVLGALLALRGLGTVGMSVATLLLMVLLTLFLCVSVRALRRWSAAEAKQRARPSGAAADCHRLPAAPGAQAATDGSRRVLVTGGAGFIGSHLTRMLLDRGYSVRVLDRFDYGRAGIKGLRHPGLEVVAGDVCSSRDVGRALRDVHGVIALAAIVGDPACNLDPEETINLNYTATKILIEACNFHRVRRLVFASSCSVYGASGGGALTEQSRLNPVSLYARTRVLSESILFDRAGDVEPVVLRLSTLFALSPRRRFDLVVNTLTVRGVADGGITITGRQQRRPDVHCRDAARAFIAALEAPAERVSGEIFNVGGDALNHTIADLGDMVAEIVGDVQIARQRDGNDLRDYRVSFAKIRQVLGFEPEWTVAAGIREVAAAVRAEPALRDYQNPAYHNVQALRQTPPMPRRRSGDWAAARR